MLYEGDNDLNANKSPQQVAADFDELLQTIRADLPEARLVVIGCKPSPARWKLIDKQRELNRLFAERCGQDKHAVFLDVEKPMLERGRPAAAGAVPRGQAAPERRGLRVVELAAGAAFSREMN